ncbi:hypothetical protein J4E05_23900 [Thalassospira sp. NFXS8]|uniref:hypothetical protein n=1 Tax=Thalassospira sp. NFXS8 TaxID=2819093 RepID=UPI0032DE5083
MNQITNEYQKAQALASSEGGRVAADGCQHCHDGNWIHLRYEYPDEQAVTDTTYVVQKPNGGEPGGEVITEGVLTVTELSRHKYIHVDLGDYDGEVEVFFFDDPTEPVPFEEPAPVEDERTWLERATESVASSIASGAQWSWETLQGDFNENMSTSQIITNAVVTAVPVVDQVADLRDLIANSKLLIRDKRYDEIGVWVGVFACLIGLVPSLGSLAKGVIKIIWKNASEMGRVLVYINKALHRTGMRVNGYRFVTKLADDVVDQVGFVAHKFDEFLDLTAQKVSLLKNLTPGFVEDTLETIEKVRRMASRRFEAAALAIRKRILWAVTDFATKAYAVLPGQSIIVRRVIEPILDNGVYRRFQNHMGREGFEDTALTPGAREITEADRAKIRRIREVEVVRWRQDLLADPKFPDSLREFAQEPETAPIFLEVLKTFGEKPFYKDFTKDGSTEIYRVIGKEDQIGGAFWSRSAPPDDEQTWRVRDAVSNDWNRGGGYMVAKVPPPPAALIGPIGPQDLGDATKHDAVALHPDMILDGGGEQLWFPKLDRDTPAIPEKQLLGFKYTKWNAPSDALRSLRQAGKIDECDL